MLTAGPRVWLYSDVQTGTSIRPPTDRPIVRDDRFRTWYPADTSGDYLDESGYHHTSWSWLRTHSDLHERVSAPPMRGTFVREQVHCAGGCGATLTESTQIMCADCASR